MKEVRGLWASGSIDIIGTNAEQCAVLALVICEPWPAPIIGAQLLKARLRDYREFLASGQLEEGYPGVHSNLGQIEVLSTHEIPPYARTLLEEERDLLGDAGYLLSWAKIGS